jgi:hypothetical protein
MRSIDAMASISLFSVFVSFTAVDLQDCTRSGEDYPR